MGRMWWWAKAMLVAWSAMLVTASAAAPVKSAYYYYGSGEAASSIDARPLTHVYYAFANMDAASYAVVPSPDDGGAIATFVAAVRRSNPRVKALLSVGGGGSNFTAFSQMARTRRTRAAFIRGSISAAHRYGFDGLDLDWEFPQSQADMSNLGSLLSEWRAAVASDRPSCPLLLTAAVKFNVTVLYGGAGTYPVQSIARNLDWVNIMAYDLHGSWETTQTAEHTALFDSTPLQTLTVNYGVTHWLEAGLPPARGVLGLAAYGYTWYLKDASANGVGAPATDSGPVYFSDDIELYARQNNGTCRVDDVTVSAYCFWATSSGRTIWAGFDDKATIAAKVTYLRGKRLRGYAFWSVAGDKNATLTTQASITLGAHRRPRS